MLTGIIASPLLNLDLVCLAVKLGEISGSQSDGYDVCCPLGCCAV
jgi:hypothetical protein